MGRFDTPADAVSYIKALEQRLDDLTILISKLGAQLDGGSIRSGTGSATWAASPFAATVVVPHDLGRTPALAAAFTRNGLVGYAVTARSSTTITVDGFITSNTNFTGSFTFDWLLLG